MPPAPSIDPALLDAVMARLDRSSHAAREASHELLAHYADTGEGTTQRAVDALIERSAGALISLSDTLALTSRSLEQAFLPQPAGPVGAEPVGAEPVGAEPLEAEPSAAEPFSRPGGRRDSRP